MGISLTTTIYLQYNFYVVLALLLAGLVAAIFGIIIGVPALRGLQGDR